MSYLERIIFGMLILSQTITFYTMYRHSKAIRVTHLDLEEYKKSLDDWAETVGKPKFVRSVPIS